MATSEASKSSRGRPAGDYQVSPAPSDDLPPLDPTLALENLSSRRTRSPSVANGTVSALVDPLDRAPHDHSSVDAFLELDEQLPPHQQPLRHLHDLSVSRIFRDLSPLPVESPRGLHYLLLQLSLQHAQEELQITTTLGTSFSLPTRLTGS